MYREKEHQIEDCIVRLSQPWVRPFVRGKTNAAVEFGAKVSISMVDGYAYVGCLDWNAYNEGTTPIEAVEKYKQENGCYPERILADKIYRTRDNLAYCKKNGIGMNGSKLGRPSEDKKLYTVQCHAEKKEAEERNAIEGKFGEGKQSYGLGRIAARLKETSETSIHLSFLVMNLEKRLRVFLRPILILWESTFSISRIREKRVLISA